jgi:nucleoporin NUP42
MALINRLTRIQTVMRHYQGHQTDITTAFTIIDKVGEYLYTTIGSSVISTSFIIRLQFNLHFEICQLTFFCLGGDNRSRGAPEQAYNRGGRPADLKHDTIEFIDKNLMRVDLSSERPLWILSCYSPVASLPEQLFGGPQREQSFEEMRFRHYELAFSGRQQEAIQEAQVMWKSAENQINNILKDIDGAVQFLRNGAKKHPNRNDIIKESMQQGQNDQPNTTPLPAQRSSAFGQPSTFTQQSNPFSQPPRSSFGQPTDIGRPKNPFAQPGNITTPANPFAQPSNPGNSISSNPFGNPTFGQSSPPSNPFGNPAFTQPSVPNYPFVQKSAFQSSSFGTPATPNKSVFGQTAMTDSDMMMSSPSFEKKTPQNVGGFGQSPTANTSMPTISVNKTQEIGTISRNANGQITSYKGRPVIYLQNSPFPYYRRVDGDFERIWFPNPPEMDTNPEFWSGEGYNDELKRAYDYARENGSFEGGVIPELAPKLEWCNWDL